MGHGPGAKLNLVVLLLQQGTLFTFRILELHRSASVSPLEECITCSLWIAYLEFGN